MGGARAPPCTPPAYGPVPVSIYPKFYHPAVKIEITNNIIQMFIQSVDREVLILYQVLVLAMVSLVKKKKCLSA